MWGEEGWDGVRRGGMGREERRRWGVRGRRGEVGMGVRRDGAGLRSARQGR